ncbi:hypothetical protein AB0D08_32890 [Kitasatospora sp. NPDC048540]|uniref:dTMP kinase n=1 Tax=unclassified Kitasatospora TaxID=2633591 RepID=UPI000539FFBB|nr:hypothetical protein [Kitasatospora sp. MBT63]
MTADLWPGGVRTPRLIAFEGLDGTGKTRLTTLLSEATGIPRTATPGPDYDALRSALHTAGGLASYLMYLSGCAQAVESAARAGEPALLVDRYWFSSAVQHGWNLGLRPDQALGGTDNPRLLLPRPDLTVLLTSDRPARLRRLGGRPDGSPHARPLGDSGPGYERYWLSCAELLAAEPTGDPVLSLDTTSDDCAPPLARLLAHPVVRGLTGPATGGLTTEGTQP